jgi:D-tyrosyl-tRNA(Tyr) deacylase
MKVVIQRVKSASVKVNSKTVSRIGKGMLLLAGLEKEDTEKDVEYCADKIAHLRFFECEQGKMNLSVMDISGEILAVSQFTVAGNIKKGRRPSFDSAMAPGQAEKLFDKFCDRLSNITNIQVKKGSFGDEMEVSLINDGPVTFIIES